MEAGGTPVSEASSAIVNVFISATRPPGLPYNPATVSGTEPAMRGRVRLVTDSSACLTVPLFEHYGIEVVPILLQVGSEEYRGTGDIQPEDVYRAIGEGVPVKSSAPSPLDYL